MRYLLSLILSILILFASVGCSKDGIEKSENSEKLETPISSTSAVSFNPYTLSVDINTKGSILPSSDENRVENYNIYCYNEKSGRRVHHYIDSSNPIELRLDNGDWEIYVIANNYEDMGKMERDELIDYKVDIASDDDITSNGSLIMTHYSSVTITEDISIPLALKRLVAKVNINLTKSSIAKYYDIKKCEVFNAPTSCNLFKENLLDSRGISFEDNDLSFYCFENMQGVKSNITDPKYKADIYAPSKATYVEITAQSSTHDIVYRYYLGANTTSDFNIARNNQYDIDINISGISSSDLRVEATKIPTVTNPKPEPDPDPDPDPVYEIRVYNQKNITLNYEKQDGWIIEFESGTETDVEIDFITTNTSSNKESFNFAGYLFLNDYFNDVGSDWNIIFHLMRSVSGSVAILTDLEDGFYTQHSVAKVKTNTKYRLQLVGSQYTGNPSSSHTIRVYMNKGTANEKYKDLYLTVNP
ncbi:MAG: DUF4906 domain-containing protein [Rikenellaceae bacterium]